MLKNYHIVARLEKNEPLLDVLEPKEPIDIIATATEIGKRLLLGVVLTAGAIFTMSTISQVAVQRLTTEKYEE